MDAPHFYPSTRDGQSCCFRSGAVLNNDAMNVHVQVLVWTYIFTCLGNLLSCEDITKGRSWTPGQGPHLPFTPDPQVAGLSVLPSYALDSTLATAHLPGVRDRVSISGPNMQGSPVRAKWLVHVHPQPGLKTRDSHRESAGHAPTGRPDGLQPAPLLRPLQLPPARSAPPPPSQCSPSCRAHPPKLPAFITALSIQSWEGSERWFPPPPSTLLVGKPRPRERKQRAQSHGSELVR